MNNNNHNCTKEKLRKLKTTVVTVLHWDDFPLGSQSEGGNRR